MKSDISTLTENYSEDLVSNILIFTEGGISNG